MYQSHNGNISAIAREERVSRGSMNAWYRKRGLRGRGSRYSLSDEVLIETATLYEHMNQVASKTGRQMRLHISTVLKRLHIAQERGLWLGEIRGQKHTPLTDEVLIEIATIYEQMNRSASKTSKRLELACSTVLKRLRLAQKRGLWSGEIRGQRLDHTPDEVFIKTAMLYEHLDRSVAKTGRRMGLHHMGVLARLRIAQERGLWSGEICKPGHLSDEVFIKTATLYEQKNRSVSKTSKQLGLCDSTVLRRLHIAQARGLWLGEIYNHRYLSDEVLIETAMLYEHMNRSANKTSKRMGLRHGTVLRRLRAAQKRSLWSGKIRDCKPKPSISTVERLYFFCNRPMLQNIIQYKIIDIPLCSNRACQNYRSRLKNFQKKGNNDRRKVQKEVG